LLHGIMSVLAEYYSLNLASEVIKGSIQKAKSGGLPGKAPVGYVNVRHVVDGREIRTVNIDPIRGPLMASAFEQYATGDLGLRQVLKDVTERGLTTVGGPNTPSKPLGLSQLARLFKHPFYKGTVRYKGVEYPGNHTPLVGIALWQQVQDVFVQRQAATEKQRKHNHYVKGSLFCARCESRLIVSKPTNRHGSTYEYFICIGRHPKRTICTMQSLPIDVVEQKVIEMYFREHRTLDRIADLEEVIRDEIARSQQAVERDRAWARRRIQTVKDKQTKLLEAHLADAVPLDILKDQQDRLGADLADAEAILDTTSQTIDNYEGALGSALELIRRLAPAYQLAGPKVRRGFNQAIYKGICLDDEDNITGEFTDEFEALLQIEGALATPASIESEEQNPDHLRGRGLNLLYMVEVGGIEPPSYEVSAPASPSAASSELSGQGTLLASFPRP